MKCPFLSISHLAQLTISAFAFSTLLPDLKAQEAFLWSKRLGNTIEIHGNSCSVMDTGGNLYMTGIFHQPCDFDPGPDTFMLAPGHGAGIFICKLSPEGNLLWAKKFRTTDQSWQAMLALDQQQNLVMTGLFQSRIYIWKFDNNGNEIWERSIGGMFMLPAIVADSKNNLIISGSFHEAEDFDPGPGTYTLSVSKPTHIYHYNSCFLLKLSGNGDFLWAQVLDENSSSDCRVNLVSDNENIYAANHSSKGVKLKKINSQGDHLWTKTFDGIIGFSRMRIDKESNILCAGSFAEDVDVDPGPREHFIRTSHAILGGDGYKYPDADMFLLKLNDEGNFIWARYFGSSDYEGVSDFNIGQDGTIFLTGTFNKSSDLDPGEGNYSIPTIRNYDGFSGVYDQEGNFQCANTIYANPIPYMDIMVNSIHLDSFDNRYTVGTSQFGYFYLNKAADCSPVSQDKPVVKEKFKIYPVPSQGNIHVRTDTTYTYRLFDLHGRTLREGTLLPGVHNLNFETFFGICYLELICGENRIVKKVVIEQ